MTKEQIIPASEFTSNFGRYKRLAPRQPVAVISHSCCTDYFIAVEDDYTFKRFHWTRRPSFATAECSEKKAGAIIARRTA